MALMEQSASERTLAADPANQAGPLLKFLPGGKHSWPLNVPPPGCCGRGARSAAVGFFSV